MSLYHCLLYTSLFLQPTTYQTDDFLSCRLWKRQDASFVRTAMTHINLSLIHILTTLNIWFCIARLADAMRTIVWNSCDVTIRLVGFMTSATRCV